MEAEYNSDLNILIDLQKDRLQAALFKDYFMNEIRMSIVFSSTFILCKTFTFSLGCAMFLEY